LVFDWKIGIALITSLAAREVFVVQWPLYTVLEMTRMRTTVHFARKMSAAVRPDGN
jgi:Fe2+ transport system protein B